LITVLAGGVGAAKLIYGLINSYPPEQINIIVNTGDDQLDFLGLYICPDLDIITYTIAGLVDPIKGWGISNDTFNCLKLLKKYGMPSWFQLGDSDLATHIYRTWLYRNGLKLHEITSKICQKLNVKPKILPMTNQYVPTFIKTTEGMFHFEEYLIKQKSPDNVFDVIYKNIEDAEPAPGVLEAIENADGIIICPSNPIVSINPILKIKDIENAVKKKNSIAISPIVGDRPVKGPADKLMTGLGYEVSAFGVAKFYHKTIKSFIIDNIDEKYIEKIKALGLNVYKFDTIMNNPDKKIELAKFTLKMLLNNN